MLELYTMATEPEGLEDRFRLPERADYEPLYQVRPGDIMPIVIPMGEQKTAAVVNASWGLKFKGRNPVPMVSMKNILKQKPYNVLIRNQRCGVPANCFFGQNEKGPILVRIPQERLFGMGGLYHYDKESGSYSFALLQTDVADVLSSLMPSMPIVFSGDRHKTWLKAAHLYDVMRFADASGHHWFDYFSVSPELLKPGTNDRELLKPLGLSAKEIQDREDKIAALKMAEARSNKPSSKR